MAKSKTTEKPWFKIFNRGKSKGVIKLYGVIGDWFDALDERSFDYQLGELGDVDEIELRIHSPGGNVMSGYFMFNLLKQHSAKVTAYVDGIAASIASYVLLAADYRHMAENARIMIHKPWAKFIGTAEDLRDEADFLDSLETDIIDEYERNSNLDRQEIADMMEEETFISAKQAVEWGFVDEIVEPVPAAAMMTDDQVKSTDVPPIRLDAKNKSLLEKARGLISAKLPETDSDEPEPAPTEQPFNIREIDFNKSKTNNEKDFAMTKDEMKELAELGGKEFAFDAFEKDKTFQDAKDELLAAQAAKLAEARDELAEIKAQAERDKAAAAKVKAQLDEIDAGATPVPTGQIIDPLNPPAADGENASGDKSKNEPKTFKGEMDKLVENGMSKTAAIKKLMVEEKDLYEKFVADAQPARPAQG